jgi:DNA-binding SARP family transcriptional activator
VEDRSDTGTELQLLGRFALSRDGRAVSLPATAQRLLAYLALHGGTAPRAEVAEALWLDAVGDHAAASLRTTLWRMPRPRGGPLVDADAGGVSLPTTVVLDVQRLQVALDGALDDPLSAPAGVDAQLERELLPGWYDEWVLVERERHRQFRLHALEDRCRALTAAGSHARALQAGLAAVAAEPLRESAHRCVVAVHVAEGNAAEALRQYGVCRDLLARELGVAPSERFRAEVAGLIGARREVVTAP